MKKIIKEFVAEFIAAFMLIIIGCGTAMATGAAVEESCGYICVALAFGLAICAIAYSVGNISGGHANPAVSLGVLINGGITPIQFVYYVIAQVLGATAGSLALITIHDGFSADDMTYSYATNAPADVPNPVLFIILVECIATFIFVMTVLGATSKKQSHGPSAGLAIAGSLAGLHLVTINLTGAAINPARFLGPALATQMIGEGDAMAYAVGYICGPLLGGLLAGVIYRLLESEDKEEKKEEEAEEKKDEEKKESDGEMTKSLFDSEFGEDKEEDAEEKKDEEESEEKTDDEEEKKEEE